MFYGSSTVVSIEDDYRQSREFMLTASASRIASIAATRDIKMMLAHEMGGVAPLVLDVNGYKKRRYESLRILAQHVAEQVEVNGRSFALEPMPAYERRIIHLSLAQHPYVTTESVGFGDARKVVVLPRSE